MRIDRDRIIDENQGFTLEKVDDFSIFRSFSCGDDDLNDFIHNDAEDHKKELLAETYVLRLQEVITPIAFCSLCNDTIQLSEDDRREILPDKKQYRYYPSVKIARLGVNKEYQKKNIGSYLIEIIKHFFMIDNRTGCRFVTVDAYNKAHILAFYQKNDFQFLNQKDAKKVTRAMYFDLKRLTI